MTLEDQISEIIYEQLGVEKIKIFSHSKLIDDLGADSLDLVEVCINVEQHFDISVPDEHYEMWETVGDIIKYLKGRGL